MVEGGTCAARTRALARLRHTHDTFLSGYARRRETELSGLRAGATCEAEIVEGAWLVFAGNMSLQIVEGRAFCTALQVSPMGVNASCFPPPGTSVAVESDLPRWSCVRIAADGSAEDTSYMQTRLSLTSLANQLQQCHAVRDAQQFCIAFEKSC